MTSKKLLPTESFRARNTAKSVALISSGNTQVCCFPREQSRSVQNSPLSLHLLPKVSLQQHYSICLLSLVPGPFFFFSQKARRRWATDRKKRERKIKGNLLSTFHDWHHNFVLDITLTSISFFSDQLHLILGLSIYRIIKSLRSLADYHSDTPYAYPL